MPRKSAKTNKPKTAIQVEGLTVEFNENVIIDDVNFEIQEGTITALIGPNGSGKTTLMKALLDLVPKSRGEILIFGKHFHAQRKSIGYVPQKFEFDRTFPITVREFMKLNCHEGCPLDALIEEKIDEVGLPPEITNKSLGTLSGGQLQRVLIAQAILNNPALLFLDEPSTGIDIVGEAEFYQVIKHLNKTHKTTILLVSHDVAFVSSLVDSVICVNKKLLCSGAPKVALTSETMKKLYGDHSAIYHHHSHQGED